mmetsp:Transcript_10787/g.40487  ORF Transcript_10787/g.40487 Transcript_10787/m.40487 type:complete len:333 (+) Transcript_10787:1031-2029(+)
MGRIWRRPLSWPEAAPASSTLPGSLVSPAGLVSLKASLDVPSPNLSDRSSGRSFQRMFVTPFQNFLSRATTRADVPTRAVRLSSKSRRKSSKSSKVSIGLSSSKRVLSCSFPSKALCSGPGELAPEPLRTSDRSTGSPMDSSRRSCTTAILDSSAALSSSMILARLSPKGNTFSIPSASRTPAPLNRRMVRVRTRVARTVSSVDGWSRRLAIRSSWLGEDAEPAAGGLSSSCAAFKPISPLSRTSRTTSALSVRASPTFGASRGSALLIRIPASRLSGRMASAPARRGTERRPLDAGSRSPSTRGVTLWTGMLRRKDSKGSETALRTIPLQS